MAIAVIWQDKIERKEKMTYQEWCIETINVILKMKNLMEGQYGYKMILKDIVRHYPEVFMINEEQEHFWTKQLSQKKLNRFRESYIKSFIMTTSAFEVVRNGSIEDMKKYLYQEHITPCEYIFEKLRQLRGKATIEGIKHCMLQNKLVLLHVKEKCKLDGVKFTEQDVDFLKRIVSSRPKCVNAEAEILEAEKLIGRSSKDHGSGIFRICKLLSSGIRFCDSEGNDLSDGSLLEFLIADFKGYNTLASH